MTKGWKRLLLMTMAAGMLSAVPVFAANVSMKLFYNGKSHAYSAKEIIIKIDGTTVTPKDMPAVAIDGRTLLPMRQIVQELGCEVTWNEEAKQVYVINSTHTLVFTIDSMTGYKNGATFTMDVPPMIINDRTMLPVRALANALDLDIQWEDATRTVAITTEKKDTTPTDSTTPVTPSVNEVTLNKVTVPTSKTAEQIFLIQASGAISSYQEVYVADDKVVLDFYGARNGLEANLTATNSGVVSAIRTAEHTTEDGTVYTRVVLDLSRKRNYTVTQSTDKTKLTITFPNVAVRDDTLKHMTYEEDDDELYLDKEKEIQTGSVQVNDHYLDGYTDIVLPGDYADVYGYGTYTIGGEVIDSIEVSTSGGKTTLRFYQNRISCYTIQEQNGQYVISIKNPQEVYDKVLLLDAGHGGSDPGASGNGIIEKNMNLTIMQKVANALSGTDIKVYVTRNSDVYPSNSSRAQTANAIADAMVSIHMNSGSTVANGTEVLYKNHANDTGSGLTSEKLAQLLQESIVAATGNTSRGTKLRTDLLILNSTTVPAVIVETVFISNPGDAVKISQEVYQNKVANAIASAIIEAFTYSLR